MFGTKAVPPRTALILSCCALAVGCGKGTGSPENNRAAAELVIQRGGSVRVQGVSYPIDRVGKLPAGKLVLKGIDLSEKQFNDDDLDALTDLKALEQLNLYGTKVTNQGLERLKSLNSLTQLELSYTLIDDEGLQSLKDLKRLEKLTLYGTQVTDDGVKSFQLRNSRIRILR
jgi:hypothetical protein